METLRIRRRAKVRGRSRPAEIPRFLVLALITVALLSASRPVAGWWDVECASGGPCYEMERAYARLIQGEACRSFYATGTCSGLCTRSLKAMLERQLWARCARHCDWSDSIVAAASSWLELCVSRPAPDATKPEDVEVLVRRGEKPTTPPNQQDTQAKGASKESSSRSNKPTAPQPRGETGAAEGPEDGSLDRLRRQRATTDLGRDDREQHTGGKEDEVLWTTSKIILVVVLLAVLPATAVALRRRSPRRQNSTRLAVLGRSSSAPKATTTSIRATDSSAAAHLRLSSTHVGARRHLKARHSYLD